jgi:hypothetical protein
MFRRGYDFTDEGSYLLIMARPREYPTYHLLTGFLFHPLYQLLDGAVAPLRIAWLAAVTLSALCLSLAAVRAAWPPEARPPASLLWPLSVTLAASSAAYLVIWLPTPNYNSLNLAAACLFGAGFLGYPAETPPPAGKPPPREGRSRAAPLPALLVAAGIWLSFLARPFTAAAMAALVALRPLADRRCGLRSIVLPGLAAAALLAATAIYVDGSFAAFAGRYFTAAFEEGLAGAHSPGTLLVPDPAYALGLAGTPLGPCFLLLFLYGFSLGPSAGGGGRAEAAGSGPSAWNLLRLLLPPACLCLLALGYTGHWWYSQASGHLLWAAPLGALARCPAARRGTPRPGRRGPGAAAPLLLLPLLPAYALGSNNGLTVATSAGAFVWQAALLAVLARLYPGDDLPRRLALLAWAGLFVAAGIVLTSLGNPYRQELGLWGYSRPARVPAGGGELLLPEAAAAYLNDLQAGAAAAGLEDGIPLIDLSGRAPGAVHALGAYTPGTLWLYSGYPGSQLYAQHALSKLSCGELAAAWILFDTRPPLRPLDPRLLLPHGIRFPGDYEVAARAIYPSPAAPGVTYLRPHLLLKPARPLPRALAACRARRAAGGPGQGPPAAGPGPAPPGLDSDARRPLQAAAGS